MLIRTWPLFSLPLVKSPPPWASSPDTDPRASMPDQVGILGKGTVDQEVTHLKGAAQVGIQVGEALPDLVIQATTNQGLAKATQGRDHPTITHKVALDIQPASPETERVPEAPGVLEVPEGLEVLGQQLRPQTRMKVQGQALLPQPIQLRRVLLPPTPGMLPLLAPTLLPPRLPLLLPMTLPLLNLPALHPLERPPSLLLGLLQL